MSRGRWVAIAILVLLAPPAVPSLVSATGSSLEWWGPTEIGQGHHIRVPVTVSNGHSYTVTNGLVVAELDIRASLIEAGWLHVPAGQEDLLSSFHLDMDSLRVVAMTDLEPRKSGTIHGQLQSTEPQLPASDPARYEIPSLVFPGRLLGNEARAFDARTNPTVTVLWRVPEPLESGDQQHYVVYFDTLQNGDKEPYEPLHTVRQAGLDALFWSGASTTLHGQVSPGEGVGTVTVVGLEDSTAVTLYAGAPGSALQVVKPVQGFESNPASVDALERLDMFVSQGQPKAFRLEASKPVLAFSSSGGFITSLDGGVLGSNFVFATTQPAASELDTVYFATPALAPTKVVVEDVETGQAYTFEMNQGDNPYPYTKGTRSGPITEPEGGGGGCQPIRAADESPRISAEPKIFRATVVEGGPVSLQLQVTNGLHPVPSVQGAATGTAFMAATGWTDFYDFLVSGPTKPKCVDTSHLGSWIATGVAAPSTLRVTNDQSVRQVDPPGTSTNPFPTPREIPQSPTMTTTNPAPLLDLPLLFSAREDDPVFLFSGIVPSRSSRPAVVGPLFGADSGLEFVGVGSTFLVSPFRSTTVEAELSFALSGTEVREIQLGAGGTTVLADKSSTDRLDSYRIHATRPLFAYPLGAGSSFLAGVPPMLDVQVHPAEFRGYLVDIGSASGLDPLTGSTAVGDPITYTLEVTNLGKALSGPLHDTVNLELVSVTPGWDATLDRDSLSLPGGGESEEVHLTVTPVGDLPSNALGIVNVKATSGGNPQMSDTMGVVTRLRSSFDVGLWFDAARFGDKSQEQILGMDVPAEYKIVVQNLGSTRDVVRMAYDEPDPGWSTLVLDGNIPVSSVALDPLGVKSLTLRVTPPPGEENGILITSLTARGSNNAVDHITAITKIRSPSDLRLEVTDPVVFVNPGEEAVFTIKLQNSGAGPADVLLGLAADDPSWDAPVVFRADASTGQRRVLDRISVGPGELVQVQVNATSPQFAEVGSTLRALIQATPREGTTALEQVLQATVQAVHDLEVTLPTPPVQVETIGTPLSVAVRLENTGNLNEVLRIIPTDLPPGWALEAPFEVFIERNGTQEFQATIISARGAAAGEYVVAFNLISQDGNRIPATIPMRVGTSAAGTTGSGDTLLAQPGRPAFLQVPVSNDGNTPLTVTVLDVDGDAWTILAPDLPTTIPPRANTTVQVGWMVPGDAPDGTSSHRLVLQLSPGQAQLAPISQTVQSEVDIGRPDLSFSDVQVTRGPSGQLINATLRNVGSRDAEDVAVQLLVGDEVFDRIEVGRVRSGAGGPILFTLPDNQAGSVRLQVDSNGAADATPGDNMVLVAPEEGRDAPLGGAWAIVGLLAVGVWGRRRKS